LAGGAETTGVRFWHFSDIANLTTVRFAPEATIAARSAFDRGAEFDVSSPA
jgi:hypothetical protein